MNNLIVHIGMHKTATTFLQRQYFPYLPDTVFYRERKFFDRFGMIGTPDKFLISNEGLSGVAWNEKWKNGVRNDHHWIDSFESSVRNLKIFFPNAQIIIVLRKHGDLLLSMYKQYVQEGGILPFDDFYHPQGVIRDKDLNYQHRLDFLSDHFDNVAVFSFEEFKSRGIEYFSSGFRALGLRDTIEPVKNAHENKSIAGKKVDLLRRINKGYRHVPSIVRKVMNRLGLSPRKIVQGKLGFWKTKDEAHVKSIVADVNLKFKTDWEYANSKFWK